MQKNENNKFNQLKILYFPNKIFSLHIFIKIKLFKKKIQNLKIKIIKK